MLNQIEKLPAYTELATALQKGNTPALVVGPAHIHKAQLIYALSRDRGKGAVVLTTDEQSAMRLAEDINRFAGEELAVHYPERELVFRQVEGVSREYEHLRLAALARVAAGDAIVVAGITAAAQPTLSPEALRAATLTIHSGEEYPPDRLIKTLLWAGYSRADQVDGICQFAVRGGIVDFYPPQSPYPVRVEYWGDEIDTINSFSVDSQRRDQPLEEASITPAREALYEPEKLLQALRAKYKALTPKQKERCGAPLLDDIRRLEEEEALPSADRYLPLIFEWGSGLLSYLGGGTLWLSECANIKETMTHDSWLAGEDFAQLLDRGELIPGCEPQPLRWDELAALLPEVPCASLDSFPRGYPDIDFRARIELDGSTLSPWSGMLDTLVEDAEGYIRDGWCLQVFGGTQRGALALVTDLQGRGLPARYSEDVCEYRPREIIVLPGSFSSGYEYPELKLAAITYGKAAAAPARRKPKAKKAGKALRDIADLTPGDYVVHVTHGIGIFLGIVKKEVQGVVKDYIQIQYAGTDMLFVPVTQLDLVTKYVGGAEEGVRLSRLGSPEWGKTRQRVKKAVSDMAKELIELYAKRAATKGYAFAPDTDWQREFEQKFEYDETDDQLRCIEEIKRDMESTVPMDRLLCGDVGFGKTEVALRGIFKCLMEGKQCAVMVPTTILAWQHYQTFLRRLEGYPVNIELLSRFRTPKQQKEIVRRLGEGGIDLVVGTHRLVSQDVSFKDLGLCVIDEEQRFGVAAKEKIKQLRSSVDMLTLSATPIPRTLNMAMSGIRDMSAINEAPQDRHPVQTYVLEFDEGVLLEAVRRELRRGGQVFWLHNRIDSIEQTALKLRELLPEARVAVGHGRMTEEQLSSIWKGLIERETDILVCTTIIEAGVDVPNCNTLIIEDADRMGLSQLYQLRGRVGRSTRRAYAYFTFRRGRIISEISEKRLEAIREFTAFGSGFRIAMRDLEIRGAGDILGSAQHGHMEAVGYDLYMRLLSDAIAEQKGEAPMQETAECLVDIQMEAHIPESYIESLPQRIDVYKKIAAIYTQEDYSDMVDELIDRFGEPPEAVIGLLEVALIRGRAARLGITEIDQRGGRFIFHTGRVTREQMVAMNMAMTGRVLVNAGPKPYITVRPARSQQPVDTIKETLSALEPQVV